MVPSQDLDDALSPYTALRWKAPNPNLPSLQLEDVSAIPFVSGVAGVEQYQHRARVRARHRDLSNPGGHGYRT